jgi:hypothetical protein
MARTVPFEDGMKIGRGYNRLTGDVMTSTAVIGPSITGVQGAGGQAVSSDCVTIQEVETLHKSLGVSVDAAGSYMGFSGSAKVDYINTCDFSSFSTYVLVKISVQNVFQSLDNPALSADAVELVVNNNPLRFRERFGDCFIDGVKTGGEYFAIYQIKGSDAMERESIAVKVHAAFKGIIASAELNAQITSATEHSKSHLDVRCHVFRQGTVGEADLNVEDIMATARKFPVEVSGDRSFPYAVSLQDYTQLKRPNDAFNYIEIQNQQDVLADLAKKRFDFLALRDDLSYILKHVEDFQNSDGSDVDRNLLQAEQAKVVEVINTMQREAAQCSRDASNCKFTDFEVGSFIKPVLRAGAVAPPRDDSVPNLVGSKCSFHFPPYSDASDKSKNAIEVAEEFANYRDYFDLHPNPIHATDRSRDGEVLSQDPPPGSIRPKGTRVDFQVALYYWPV